MVLNINFNFNSILTFFKENWVNIIIFIALIYLILFFANIKAIEGFKINKSTNNKQQVKQKHVNKNEHYK